MMIKVASCFVLTFSMMLGGCVGDDTEVESTQSEDVLAPEADENGAWTLVTDGVWERTRSDESVEQYAAGVAGLTWQVQQQKDALTAFQKDVVGSSSEGLSKDQQKTLEVLQANLDATEKALVKVSSPEAATPGLQPEYYTSSAWLGSCTDFLVAGPTSGTGAFAYSEINSACPSFYLSAYATANGLTSSISTSYYRGVSATVTNGTYSCTSQAYAQANGWGHTLTYPYCN